MSQVDEVDNERVFELPGLEVCFILVGLVLTFQLWPEVYLAVIRTVLDVVYWLVSPFDVRRWGWRSYMAANIGAFVLLAVIRSWQNRDRG